MICACISFFSKNDSGIYQYFSIRGKKIPLMKLGGATGLRCLQNDVTLGGAA